MIDDLSRKTSLSLRWIYLAWIGLVFSSLVIGIIAGAVQNDPEAAVLMWGIVKDFSIFALTLYCLGTLLAVFILYLLLKEKGLNFDSVGIKGKLSFRASGFAIIGLAVAFTLYPAVETLLKPFGVSMFWKPDQVVPLNLTSAPDVVLTFLFAVILGPIVEEIIFRGYVLTAILQKKERKLMAIVLSALVFTSVHAYLGPGVMVFIFFWTFIPAFLYLKFDSLYPAILFHVLNNFVTYIIFPLFYK